MPTLKERTHIDWLEDHLHELPKLINIHLGRKVSKEDQEEVASRVILNWIKNGAQAENRKAVLECMIDHCYFDLLKSRRTIKHGRTVFLADITIITGYIPLEYNEVEVSIWLSQSLTKQQQEFIAERIKGITKPEGNSKTNTFRKCHQIANDLCIK